MEASAYQNTYEEVLKSSSGGAYRRILHTICSLYPNQRFSFYGAAWNKDLTVSHHRVLDIEKAAAYFSGSKYVRSDVSKAYPQVAKDLEKNYYVIFCGTPCQVYGVKSYIDRKNITSGKLFTIDIICHGTPKQEILKDMLDWWSKRAGSDVVSVSFRDKRVGWMNYPVSIRFKNGKEWINNYITQLYIRLFFTHYIMYRGCYSCKFSNMNRHSDITIGDFWGIEEVFPSLQPKKGVSLMLANSSEGEKIAHQIEQTLSGDEHLVHCEDDSFLKYQHNLNKPTEMPEDYDQFWKDLDEKGFDYIIRKYKVYTLRSFGSYCKWRLISTLKSKRHS